MADSAREESVPGPEGPRPQDNPKKAKRPGAASGPTTPHATASRRTPRPTAGEDPLVSILRELLTSRDYQTERKSREAPEELEHRLRKQRDEDLHERKKDLIFFTTTVALCCIALLLCVWVLARPGRDPDDVRWAAPLLTLIVGGFAGRYTAKPVGK